MNKHGLLLCVLLVGATNPAQAMSKFLPAARLLATTQAPCFVVSSCMTPCATRSFSKEIGALVNAVDVWGNSSLHLMVEKGDIAGVEKLLARGADVCKKNCDGHTPLMLAEYGREIAKRMGRQQEERDYEEIFWLLQEAFSKDELELGACDIQPDVGGIGLN